MQVFKIPMLEDVADEVIRLFPTEVKASYYIAPSPDRRAGAGKLVDRFKNQRRFFLKYKGKPRKSCGQENTKGGQSSSCDQGNGAAGGGGDLNSSSSVGGNLSSGGGGDHNPSSGGRGDHNLSSGRGGDLNSSSSGLADPSYTGSPSSNDETSGNHNNHTTPPTSTNTPSSSSEGVSCYLKFHDYILNFKMIVNPKFNFL
jgi:hypothetical protein